MAEEAELIAYWGREQRLAALEETLADADAQTQVLLALAEEDSPQPPGRRRSLRVWRGGLGLVVALVAFVALTLLAAPQAREAAAAVIHEAVRHVSPSVAIADAASSDPLLQRDTPTARRANRDTVVAPQVPNSSVSPPSQRGPAAAGPLPVPAAVAIPVPPSSAGTPPPSPPSSGNQQDSQQGRREGSSQPLPGPTPSDKLPRGLADRASLPPGLAKKKELPPGLAKKVSLTPPPSP